MKKPSELVRDMYVIHDELTTPTAFPEGITAMDVVRFQSGAMPAAERKQFKGIMQRNPDFAAEMDDRQQLDEQLFSSEALEKYEQEIFAALGVEIPLPLPPIWEAIREKAEALYAETRAALFPPFLETFRTAGQTYTSPKPFGGAVDTRLLGTIKPDRERKRIRVLVQIGDRERHGETCRLTWFQDNENGSGVTKHDSKWATLKRFSDESRTVTAEFFLDEEEATGALKAGFTIEPGYS